jgi:hypothetical protein
MSEALSSNGMLMGMLVGGSVISVLGATSVYIMDKEKPRLKTILRDFIIGAVLVMMLLQIMPETTVSLVQGVSNVVGSLPEVASAAGDIEMQTGIPKF